MQSNTGWDTVTVLRKRPPKPSETRGDQAVRLAQQRGVQLETTRKFNAATNKQHVMTKSAAKLDKETEAQHIDTVGIEVGRIIQKGRQTKKWTQADLARQINEKQSVVNEYESGRAVVNQQVLSKLERAIGLKLRGKDKGSVLETKTGGKAKAQPR
ncbi:endothelial differentiation factor 1 [Trichuris trichiura]|uniref:Endothelial differentiation factor 1 n=1 Tax=Trichuris trichiura TaxID=36087 RepID=A0A077ZKB4_TRITR|nr:endothelial differentiation factor 1 [Trichuris trichiura]